MFTRYKNLNRNSNVNSYRINSDSIDVIFNGCAKVYRYSYKSAGKYNVDQLIARAIRGFGLNSYININCKYLYER